MNALLPVFTRHAFAVVAAAFLMLLPGCAKKQEPAPVPQTPVEQPPKLHTDRYAGEAHYIDYDLNGVHVDVHYADSVTINLRNDSVQVGNSVKDTIYSQDPMAFGQHNHAVGFDLRGKVDTQSYFAGNLLFHVDTKLAVKVYADGDSLQYDYSIHGGQTAQSYVTFRGRKLR